MVRKERSHRPRAVAELDTSKLEREGLGGVRSVLRATVAQQSFAPTVEQHTAVLLLMSDVAQERKTG